MSRRALIVGDAAGAQETAAPVLARFGFTSIVRAANIDEALGELRGSSFGLLILPIQDMSAAQLAALDRQIRIDKQTLAVGTAPRLDPELILRAMRAGIQEFLVWPPDTSEFASAIDRLMRRSPSVQAPGRVIAVFSSKGGVGNTSIAVNISDALVRSHSSSRVALVDLVIEGGDTRVLLNLRSSYHLGDLIEKLDRVDAELLYSLLTPTPGGLWVLPAPDNTELDDVLDAITVSAMLAQFRAHFAYTILDCEHHLSERTLAALDASDNIVLVTQLNVTALRSAQRALDICKRLGYASDKVVVVVNRYQTTDVLTMNDAEKVLGAPVFQSLPNDYQLLSTALTRGAPIAAIDADAKLSRAFEKLALSLAGPGGDQMSTEPAHAPKSALRRLFIRRKA